MRRGKSWAVLAMVALVGCGQSKPLRDMVGYVPPTSLPAQPKRTMVQDEPAQVWNNILDYLDQSDFAIDHTDGDSKLIVARYSGNPEPYIDCGSIVTHENGALGQIAGAAEDVTLNYRLDNRPVILKRGLNLDSRVIIRLQEQRLGTVVSTDTTYVVTKTIDVERSSGKVAEGSRETVSFSAGKRAEFSKGTACQPNGSLDLAILQSLPNVVGSNEITRADLPVDPAEETTIADGIVPPRPQPAPLDPSDGTRDQNRPGVDQTFAETQGIDNVDAAVVPGTPDNSARQGDEPDWTKGRGQVERDPSKTGNPDTDPSSDATQQYRGVTLGRPNEPVTSPVTEQRTPIARSAPASKLPAAPTAIISAPDQTTGINVDADDVESIVDETTRTLLATFDCQGTEWHYCQIVTLTAPYRKVNIENAFGLTINTAENFASQTIGNDLRLDVDLPGFPSYLHVIYIERDGTIDHVISSSELWPADLSHRLEETGLSIPGPSGVAMIVAIVSEQPLFPAGQLDKEQARPYLSRLEQRLSEIDAQPGDNRIAASQLLINVE